MSGLSSLTLQKARGEFGHTAQSQARELVAGDNCRSLSRRTFVEQASRISCIHRSVFQDSIMSIVYKLPVISFLLSVTCCIAEESPLTLHLSTKEVVEELLSRSKAGEWTGNLTNVIARHGMRAAEIAAENFDEANGQNEALCKLIARVGRIRKSYLATVQLYDPAAFDVFYTVKGRKIQERIAQGLGWKEWPPSLSAAVVRAAPFAGLVWLNEQSRAEKPNWPQVQALVTEWGRWINDGNERQYVHHVHTVVASFLEHEDLRTHPEAQAVLLSIVSQSRPSGCCSTQANAAAKLIGMSLLERLETTAVTASNSSSPAVRTQAMKALGRLGSETAEKAFLNRLSEESDSEVLVNAANASSEFKNKEATGNAMLALFAREQDIEVRKAILFAAESADWPQTEALLLKAFEQPGDGLLGVALGLAAEHEMSPDMKAKVLNAGVEYESLTPALIDAIGRVGNEAAAMLLAGRLPDEKNEAVRLKLLLALEKTGTEVARKTFMRLLQEEASPLVMEHLIAIAGRLRLGQASKQLMSLAEDPTAPLMLRSQALWSLGAFNTEEVKDFLKTYEPELPEGIPPESSSQVLNQAAALAKFRIHSKDGEPAVQHCYDRASPSDRLSMLMGLAEAGLAHPIIAQSLKSQEFIEVYGAIRAAGTLDKDTYSAELESLEKSILFAAMLSLPLDLLGLPGYFDKARSQRSAIK